MNMELSTSSVSVVCAVMMLSVLVLHVTPHRAERIVPRIVPSKLQLLEHANLTVNCEGFFKHSSDWRVLRKVMNITTPCNRNKTFGPCHISSVFSFETGEYWCESRDQHTKSERVHITITENVVLESPVRPVMVGDNVTLRCIEKKNKNPSIKFSFYKDNISEKASPTGEMTLHNISVSNQGWYKCSTSDKEFSSENLLRVTAVFLQCPDRPVMEGSSVTMTCVDKMATPNYTASLYKDGEVIKNSSSGKFTLKVSKSDEGVYKCRGSEGRESEEHWLSVRDGFTSVGDLPVSQFKVSSLTGLFTLPLLLIIFWFIYKQYKGRRVSGGSETYAVISKPKHTNRAAAQSEPTAFYSEISDVKETSHASNDCGVDTKVELHSIVNKKKKKHDASNVGKLYSVVKKNKGKKSMEPSCETTAEDSFYSLIH